MRRPVSSRPDNDGLSQTVGPLVAAGACAAVASGISAVDDPLAVGVGLTLVGLAIVIALLLTLAKRGSERNRPTQWCIEGQKSLIDV